jgi:UDP-GlcNAc3NAcA epimerase
MTSTKILTVVGARPQFVKAAVISRYLRESPVEQHIEEVLVHTGQHYDAQMSDVFFRELDIPAPHHNLEVGSASSATQMARIIDRLGPVFQAERPDMVLVYGDTHSTLAAGIVAAHMNIPLTHVEAGERIYRRHEVPEEINRILTDNASSLCLSCTERATRNLLREGMAPGRVRFVGDPMYDLFLWARERVGRLASVSPATYGLEPGKYFLATIHRAQNTRDADAVLGLFNALDRASRPVLLPVHPRVKRFLNDAGWVPQGSLRLLEPLGYFDFMALLLACHGTVTDSGGVSRESYYAGKPCIVPMQNCWWPEVVDAGWICEAGSDPGRLLEAMNTFRPPQSKLPLLFGDGRSAEKIIDAVQSFLTAGGDPRWHHLGTSADVPPAHPTTLTHEAYRGMLAELTTAGYRFLGFPEAEATLAEGSPFALLRHDVDIDLEPALHLAEIEAAAGVRATYFFLVRTETYNVFSAAGSETVLRILGLGHRLGLHFDCAAYPENSSVDDLATACRRESAILEEWFGQPVSVVSYHRPSRLVLTGDAALSAPRPHTYQRLFTGPIHYLSDSRGIWSRGGPIESEAFRQRRPLHILVHPIWWNDRPVSPFEVLERYSDRRRDRLKTELARNCSVYRTGLMKESLTCGIRS